jgi:hypothetical protein
MMVQYKVVQGAGIVQVTGQVPVTIVVGCGCQGCG